MTIALKKSISESGFALVLTLVLLALILVIVVAYLGNTRIDRATSVTYSGRLRAQTTAESGLASAIHLLRDNTHYGNYITAVPAMSPTPSPFTRWTEVYRPQEPSPTPSNYAPDYLRLENAVGDILASRALAGPFAAPTPQVDPRPTPQPIATPLPAGSPFAVDTPNFSTTNSYDFNQIIRLGTSSSGHLVNPDGQAAFGQWVRVRNSTGDLIGRYAFFIEDESMKVNVNVAGNNLGTGSSNLRINDLTLPTTTPAPATQIREIDPAAILPTTANRATADTTLTSLGNAGSRLPSKLTLGLLNEWATTIPDYAHITTVLSQDDDTTARGWQRLDLNNVVTDAETIGTNAAKLAAATRVANWIRDAWTGPRPLVSMTQEYQIFGNQRLRLQLAANIVDYIDADNVPTDMDDILPDGYTDPAYAIPVIGIEKIPYLGLIFIIYEASGRVGNTATMKMKIRFNFFNLYESSLNVTDFVKRIEIQGVPVILKKNAEVFNRYNQTFSIQASDLLPLGASGFSIPPGSDGSVLDENGSGARSFETTWLVPGDAVTFSTLSGNPVFQVGQVQVRVFGLDAFGNEVRLDVTAAATTDTPNTGYQRSGSTSIGDFLLDSDTVPRSVAAIYQMERVVGSLTQTFGDPRFRASLLNERWRRLSLTDTQAVNDRLNKMNSDASTYPNPRSYGVDWFDYYADRPLAFLRNGPVLNVGELGNVAFAEYPWRTG